MMIMLRTNQKQAPKKPKKILHQQKTLRRLAKAMQTPKKTVPSLSKTKMLRSHLMKMTMKIIKTRRLKIRKRTKKSKHQNLKRRRPRKRTRKRPKMKLRKM